MVVFYRSNDLQEDVLLSLAPTINATQGQWLQAQHSKLYQSMVGTTYALHYLDHVCSHVLTTGSLLSMRMTAPVSAHSRQQCDRLIGSECGPLSLLSNDVDTPSQFIVDLRVSSHHRSIQEATRKQK